MVRIQIQLTEDQLQAVRLLAEKTHTSHSEIIRQGVDRILAERTQPQSDRSRTGRVARALRSAGKFASGDNDVSVNHDKYLAEAIGH